MLTGITATAAVTRAMQAQAHLGNEFLLRGLLDKQWLSAMCAIEDDKPMVKLTHLHIGLWKVLFSSVWETRNTILHGKDSITRRYERATMIGELAEWKRQAPAMLGSKQVCLAAYSMQDAIRWSTTLMKETLKLLSTAARNYKEFVDNGTSQTRLTDFFHQVGNADIDEQESELS